MRKRGARRAQVADPGAFLRAVGLQQRLDDGQQVDLMLTVRAAVLALRSGAGCEHHAWALASALNAALVLAERGTGAEWLETIVVGQLAVQRLIERARRSWRWGFDGPAMGEVEAALKVYEAQLSAVPRIEVRDAVREVSLRVDRGLVFEVETLGKPGASPGQGA